MIDQLPEAAAKPGCLASAALFAGVWIAGSMMAMLVYVLVVEQWALIAVRREFSYEMVLLWAPLIGLVAAIATSFWNQRGGRSGPRTTLLAGVACLIGLALLMLFTGFGAFF